MFSCTCTAIHLAMYKLICHTVELTQVLITDQMVTRVTPHYRQHSGLFHSISRIEEASHTSDGPKTTYDIFVVLSSVGSQICRLRQDPPPLLFPAQFSPEKPTKSENGTLACTTYEPGYDTPRSSEHRCAAPAVFCKPYITHQEA